MAFWPSIVPAAIENLYCFKAPISDIAFAEPEENYSAHAWSQIKVIQAVVVRLWQRVGVREYDFDQVGAVNVDPSILKF